MFPYSSLHLANHFGGARLLTVSILQVKRQRPQEAKGLPRHHTGFERCPSYWLIFMFTIYLYVHLVKTNKGFYVPGFIP